MTRLRLGLADPGCPGLSGLTPHQPLRSFWITVGRCRALLLPRLGPESVGGYYEGDGSERDPGIEFSRKLDF